MVGNGESLRDDLDGTPKLPIIAFDLSRVPHQVWDAIFVYVSVSTGGVVVLTDGCYRSVSNTGPRFGRLHPQ